MEIKKYFKNLGLLAFGIFIFNIPYVIAYKVGWIPFDIRFKAFLDVLVFLLLYRLKKFSVGWGLFRGEQ